MRNLRDHAIGGTARFVVKQRPTPALDDLPSPVVLLGSPGFSFAVKQPCAPAAHTLEAPDGCLPKLYSAPLVLWKRADYLAVLFLCEGSQRLNSNIAK